MAHIEDMRQEQFEQQVLTPVSKQASFLGRAIQLFYRFTIPSLLLMFFLGLSGIFLYTNYQQSELIKTFTSQEEQLYQAIASSAAVKGSAQQARKLLTEVIFNETENNLRHNFMVLTGSLSIFLLIIIFIIHKLKNNSAQLEVFVNRLQAMNGELQNEMKKRDEMARRLEELNNEFKYQSLHDALTKLPNRRLFEDRLHTAIQISRRKKQKFAVLFLDLDGFKVINDTLGHDVGDELLKAVSCFFVSAVRSMDTVARLGGDEFAFILADIDKPESALFVAERILSTVKSPVEVKGHSLRVNASIGMTIYPDDSDSGQMLLKNADIAMYSAKNAGRGNIQFYREELNLASKRELLLRNALGAALQNNELKLHYQPVVDIRQHAIVYFEALLRWNHPQLGYISPLEILSLAAQLGLYSKLEEWVIQTVLHQLELWKKENFTVPRVCINISPRQLESKDYIERFKNIINSYSFGAESLILEITEATPVNNTVQVKNTLDQLIELGVKIAIDDFGTSYSSMNYLRWLPIHILKIDRLFVQELDNAQSNVSITKAIINLANDMGLEIIAEGVETKDQLRALESLGCFLMQGYLFSKPVAAEECLHIAISTKD